MKKFYCSLSLFCLIAILLPTQVYASDDILEDSIISIEEYEDAVQAACAEYDIDCYVIDYDPNVQITQEMLEHAITSARQYAESVQSQQDDVIDLGHTYFESVPDNDASPFGVMPSTLDYFGTFFIENAYGNAYMRIDANITTNLASNSIMYVNSTDVYQLGGFVNFVNWTTTSVSYTKEYPYACWVTFYIEGRATFAYADPWTGITTGYTSNESKRVMIDCT